MSRPKLPQDRIWISPSQYDTYKLCKRKWAAKYIAKLPDRPGKAALLGTEIHAELEAYYRDGRPPKKHVRLVSSMLKLLALPRSEYLEPEHEMRMDILAGRDDRLPVAMVGYIDLLNRDPNAPMVIDYKTTSDARWAKTKEDLEGGDSQAVCYQTYAMCELNMVQTDLRWVYGQTKGRRAPWMVQACVPDDVRLEVMSKIQDAATDIREMKIAKPDLDDVEPNIGDACNAFGGCPYREQCELATSRREEMNKADLIAQWKAKQGAVAKATKPAPIEDDKTETGPVTVDGPAPEPDHDPINPPEAKGVPEKPEAPAPEPKKATKKVSKKPKAPKVVDEVAEQVAPAVPLLLKGDLHVYVDCFPLKGVVEPVMLLSDVCETAARVVCANAGVPHWSLAEYGSGKGGLAVEFERTMPRSGSVIVNSYTDEGKVLLPVLERNAKLVVKG